MSKPKKIRKTVPLVYYKREGNSNYRPLVIDNGCSLWIFDIIKRDFISNEESKDRDRNELIPVVAINKQNAIKKVGKILLKLANAHKILEEIVKQQENQKKDE
jgi:hypothetical protein